MFSGGQKTININNKQKKGLKKRKVENRKTSCQNQQQMVLTKHSESKQFKFAVAKSDDFEIHS